MRSRERGSDEQRPGDPGHDGQHVEGEELGVLVGEADAGEGAASVAVHELELVELVAERHRQQEQPAEDREMERGSVSRTRDRRATHR